MPRHVSLISIFGLSVILTVFLLGAIGFSLGAPALLTMLTLTVLEITFSLDNAVVNATILQRMSRFWQRMFMTAGIVIAVFGMRLLFPIVLVAVTAGLSLNDALLLALHSPGEYAARLAQAEPVIAAFGGLFLLMIFLSYFFTGKRKRLWQAGVVLLVFVTVMLATPADMQATVAVAGLLGVGAHLVVGTLASAFSARQPVTVRRARMPWRAGLIMFLYLELLDASFSFDSVIGAFAVTTNTALIAVGLGAGALWVRSITIYLVRRGALAHFPYLDAGAHYAIGALAILLLLGAHIQLPDALTGGAGLFIILVSFAASIWKNRQVKLGAKPGA